MKNSHKYHYVYRITNIILKKYYYGVRSCQNDPKDDLGHKYFSSSTDKYFIQDQKNNSQHYKYKIIKLFKNRESAELFETKLHEKLQVQIHESFYNKAINTNMGFSVLGRKQSAEHISKRIRKGMVAAVDLSTGSQVYVSVEEFRNNDNLISVLKDKKFTEEHKNNISKSKMGMKLSDEHRSAISNGTKERYENDEFYKVFCKTMTEVNQRKDKRELAGEKIKEKWKDPSYLEKMKNRPHGSNSKRMKEKWKDPEWKKKVLESRKAKNKHRLKLFDILNGDDDIVYTGLTIKEASKIWNNLHRVTKENSLGTTRQSLKYLESKDALHLKGYYSKESK